MRVLPARPVAGPRNVAAWAATVVLTFCATLTAQAQRPLNLDFERPSVAGFERPWGWTLGWSAFPGGPAATSTLDSTVRRHGRRSLRITAPDSVGLSTPQTLVLQLPSRFALGRDLEVVAWVRVASLGGRALVALEAWRDREVAAADTAAIHAAAGAAPAWTRHTLRIRVPADAGIHSVVLSTGLQGPGTAWFDSFELRVDGRSLRVLPPRAAPPSAAQAAWLADHAGTLRSVRPASAATGPDDADLAAFADIVGDAQIVGLGESTHGTREFFLLKHRLLEFLVRRHGFRVFAIEANQLAVARIDRYVHGGEGTAREVMRAMFQVWNTGEMLDLVEWVRSHNATNPVRNVRFVGYDMQDHRAPADTLRAYLERTDPAAVRRFEALVSEYRSQRSYATPWVADTTRARWHRQAEVLWNEIQVWRPGWLARQANRADTLGVERAVQAANLLRQAARFNASLSSPERDSLMAANLDWVLRNEAPGQRAVVWAHDVHVSRGGNPALSFNGGAQLGAYLSRIYGDRYRAFSLLTYEGAYSATKSFSDHRLMEAAAFTAPAGSLEAALHQLVRPRRSVGLIVDLRPARHAPAGEWLRQARPIRHIGYAAYDYGFEFDAVLPLEFDGVVFIDRTTPSRMLL